MLRYARRFWQTPKRYLVYSNATRQRGPWVRLRGRVTPVAGDGESDVRWTDRVANGRYAVRRQLFSGNASASRDPDEGGATSTGIQEAG